ncbi:hypothetical protein [Bradyrhizobium sp. STM 3561]|uniref:hypothetical protein n=1 Tax=unclassified Bradyrhizobium TaxID=2631580 RepID=UPI00388E7352
MRFERLPLADAFAAYIPLVARSSNVSTLLKAVILSTALVVVIGFSISAWNSWCRLQQANRILAVAATSANVFKAMANIRSDRSTSNRQLTSDIQMDKDIETYIRGIRDELMPALARAKGTPAQHDRCPPGQAQLPATRSVVSSGAPIWEP